MQVVIRPDSQTASWLVARLIAGAIREKPSLTLGLATGRTMERLYSILAEMHAQEGLDFSRVRTFNLDEYIGLDPGHESSYHYYMNTHLFSRVNMDPKNAHLPDGRAENLAAECRRYEDLIRQCEGLDLQLLGIGRDGHIGFNEPLSALVSRTRDKSLAPMTVAENARMFDNPKEMPHRALTMGVGTILEARRIILLATGPEKAEIVARAVEGPITSMVTASALQLHARCTVIVDEEAASRLQAHDYYRWIFENEPEWEEFRT